MKQKTQLKDESRENLLATIAGLQVRIENLQSELTEKQTYIKSLFSEKKKFKEDLVKFIMENG